MPWLTRGLREGVVTSRWPGGADVYEGESRSNLASVTDRFQGLRRPDLVELCPTGAIVDEPGGVRVVAERCIGCGLCVREAPDTFTFSTGSGQARLVRSDDPGSSADWRVLRASLAARTRRLGRSVHLRHVDAGSDGTEEWEINALFNPDYDVHRLGIFLTPSPRHADLLLVTGIGSTGMAAPLRRTWEAMPHPKLVLAIGTDACTGGLLAGSPSGSGGVGGIVDVDVWVPGAPPTPFAILHGILLALGRLPDPAREGGAR
jgi:Ni,Fe-hydrogenase III small subunit/ferredoxin